MKYRLLLLPLLLSSLFLSDVARATSKTQDLQDEATTLNNIGKAYYDLGEKEKAQSYFNQALPFFRAVSDSRFLAQEASSQFPELQALLQAQKWFEASTETISIIRNNSSCPNLRNIDQLWVKYSNGKYGLTPQFNIWKQVGGLNCTTCQNQIEKFAQQVGWKLSIPTGVLPGDFVGKYPVIALLGWESYVDSTRIAWRQIKEFDIFAIWQQCQ